MQTAGFAVQQKDVILTHRIVTIFKYECCMTITCCCGKSCLVEEELLELSCEDLALTMEVGVPGSDTRVVAPEVRFTTTVDDSSSSSTATAVVAFGESVQSFNPYQSKYVKYTQSNNMWDGPWSKHVFFYPI